MNNHIEELAEGLLYLVKWDDYDALEILREQNTKPMLIAASKLLSESNQRILFSMVNNANSGTIPAFETITAKKITSFDPKSNEFVVGNTYLIDGIEITIDSIGTHGITGSDMVKLFDRITTIELVKDLAKV
jgi:hypothetical protein